MQAVQLPLHAGAPCGYAAARGALPCSCEALVCHTLQIVDAEELSRSLGQRCDLSGTAEALPTLPPHLQLLTGAVSVQLC